MSALFFQGPDPEWSHAMQWTKVGEGPSYSIARHRLVIRRKPDDEHLFIMMIELIYSFASNYHY